MKKHLPIIFVFTIICLTSVLSQAQFEKENKEALAAMDTTALKGKAFLNKASFIRQFIEPLRSKEKNKEGNPILTLSSLHFEALTQMVEKADLNDKPKPKEITDIQTRSRDQITSSNVIPIGILNADATFLTQAQVNDNIKAKNQGKKADEKAYENIEMIAAGLLQGEVFQADVQFQISPKLVQTNIKNPIEGLEIDFQDGKGWQRYEYTERLIPHRFTTTGTVAIALKLITKRGIYITYCPLQIKALERPTFFATGKIAAPKVKNGRLAENVAGAEYAILTGCDGVLDRPIIIAEGFDVGQDINMSDIYTKYYPFLYTFRNNGYDLVFVNYDDGRDYIQNNAQVLKRVINEINSRKVGSYPLVVVGESMSGLVARWALREMENAGQTHNVSHFISFDTPHQGANVPPGLVAMRRNLEALAGFRVSALVKLFVPEVQAIDTPAARQLLLYHNGTARHPDFDSFRQGLVNLGNGGYPAQCRNVALLNGSLSGVRQNNATGGGLNPGDRILDVDFWGILCNAFLSAWTNNLNQNTMVYEGAGIGICNGASYGNLHVNLPFNFDRLPGGFINPNFDNFSWPLMGYVEPRFSFVPTFSSIDYRGTLNSDNDYTFAISNNIINANNQVIRPDLTPFAAIYGNNDNNTDHSFSQPITSAWNTLAQREFGLSQFTIQSGCTLPIPPAVVETRQEGRWGQWVNRPLTTVCKHTPTWKLPPAPNVVTLLIPNGDQINNYRQFIRVEGNGHSLVLGVDATNRVRFNYNNLPIGTYTISAVRQYFGTSTGEVSTSGTFQIIGNCRIGVGCPADEDEGEIIGTLVNEDKVCYAHKVNGTWIAALEDGSFVSRSRLIANGISVDGANCFAETDPQGSNPASSCPNLGSISYQRWENIGGGTSITDFRNATANLTTSPSFSQNLALFEAPINIADSYGARFRGYICPPTTGNYTFWVAGDDNVELWLSTNEDPVNAQRIAYHNNWTNPQDWFLFNSQQSVYVNLQAGQKYYIEAVMKEGFGGDNLAVGWQLPNGAMERPIPGNRLIPFDGGSGSSCNFSLSPSSSNATPSCGASVTLNANCSGSDCGGVSYTWSGNGLSSSSSSVSTNVPSSNGTYTYTVTASKSGCGNQAGSVNVTVSGCSSGGGSLNQCIESESSSGSGAITSDPNASNGSTRGEENNYNHYVDYVVTSVPSAGTYYVKLRYYSSAAPTIGVQINGGGSSNISLPSSGSWNIVWAEHTFTVSLSAGTNTIRIQGVSGGSCRQDRICVSSNPPRIGLEKEGLATDTEVSILELYPNPTGGKVTVQYYLEKGQKASLQFINASGQVLLQKSLTGEGNWQKSQADLSEHPEGSYAVRMETQEKIVSRKFLIIK
ncbi:PA14 domain-containing protein [Runella limosa]|uniref:PA14 domain-containing protein n=1 Tax=Runella limosa TaxID=370978 RepID=UPI0004015916|nr:PA14 domain-containing protein [Runella limosa]